MLRRAVAAVVEPLAEAAGVEAVATSPTRVAHPAAVSRVAEAVVTDPKAVVVSGPKAPRRQPHRR